MLPLLGPDEWFRRGARISAWLHDEPVQTSTAKSQRKRQSYPAQARVKGESLHILAQATLSTPEKPAVGADRAYLERDEAQAFVLQDAPIEDWPERWSIWMRPSEANVSTDTMARVLTEELGRRFGVDENDVFVVEHSIGGHPHVHAVVPATESMDLTREAMARIGREMVRELALERQVERAMEVER